MLCIFIAVRPWLAWMHLLVLLVEVSRGDCGGFGMPTF